MDINKFDFDLPDHLIAQSPLSERTASRLLVIDERDDIHHDTFSRVSTYLQRGDVLVINDTRVMPARIIGENIATKGKIELLLLHEHHNNEWEVLAKPARRVKVGTKISFGSGQLVATCIHVAEAGKRIVKLDFVGQLLEILDELGEMPLPPYIKKQLEHDERYQTVYAKQPGSAAAPTAGLHFTRDMLADLENKGVTIVPVTLHVGLGTFRPVAVDNIKEHTMHEEYYEITEKTAQVLNAAKLENRKIISVGTTTTRVLETMIKENDGKFLASSGWTDIFIYPPYKFAAVDGLITNFHLPKSTLLMLVSAFSKRDVIIRAYEAAIEREYRFFSFGDAMFILPNREGNDDGSKI